MNDPLAVAVEWLSETGAPNWLVVLAIVTRPTTWAREAKSRIGGVLDLVAPSGDAKATTAETPDDDPRE